MPTSLRRVMVSLPKDLELQMEKVAKAERRPMASLCLTLIETGLKTPRYREVLEAEPMNDEDTIEQFGLDQLSPERLKELGKLLKLLEAMKD